MLICTLLTFAMCADPNVPAAISIGDMTVPIVWKHEASRSCMDLGSEHAGDPGDALMRFESGPRDIVRVSMAAIAMTAYAWPRMSDFDRAALRLQYRATLWHEIGHIVIARNSIANTFAIGLRPLDAFDRISRDQRDYDDLTGHGIQQHLAQPPLDGADTIVECRS